MVFCRPAALGRKRTLLRQGSQRWVPPLLPLAATPRQRLQRTVKVMSLRPPLSSGQLQSRITEVSLMDEITFRGAEGGPGRQKRGEMEVEGGGQWIGERFWVWGKKVWSRKEIEEREMRRKLVSTSNSTKHPQHGRGTRGIHFSHYTIYRRFNTMLCYSQCNKNSLKFKIS